jgi:diacylglycerol kinase (ATP)
MSQTALFIIIAIITACILTVAAMLMWRGWSRWRRVQLLNKRDDDQVKYAFIINPSKPQAARAQIHIEEFCKSHNIDDIEFIETTLERDGLACAQEALKHGADVLVAVGGDGTVRTVAGALSGTEQTLGIIPIGTGNLFARNMGIPVDDMNAALAIATSRGERMVDTGRLALLDHPEDDNAHAFLIIAGIGFDADMISDTDPELKKSISWLAYFSGGMKNMFAPKYRGAITITKADGTSRTIGDVHFRTFLAGNCGQIPVFSLMPDASFDDGLLDYEIIDTSGGLLGWMNLVGDVVHQTVTGRVEQSSLSTNSTMDQVQGTAAEIKLEKPALAQVDGDMLGSTSHIRFSVEPRSLRVRVPAAEASQ